MSTTEVALPQAPNYLAALIAANPELAAINQDALAGSSKPMPPTIVANKGKFVTKIDKDETTIVFPDTEANRAAGIVGTPVSRLQAVVLRAKPGKEKAWYATKYTPGQETQAPDCSSDDGITPNADSRLKQCENCASCPQNVFGTGTNQDGVATGGKACADKKVIAIFANGGAFRFAIPPASLGNWDKYCNQLTTKGLPLPAVITYFSFSQGDDDYKLEFSFAGMLAEAQLTKIVPLLQSPEVKDIVSPRTYQAALPAPTQTATALESKSADTPDPSIAVAAAAKKDAEDKAAAKKAAADAKKAKDAAEAAAKKAKEDAAGAGADLGLGGIDLGLGDESAGETTTAPPEPPAPQSTAGPDDSALIDSLNL